MGQRVERLAAHLRVVAGDVDQVDGVDVDRLDRARAQAARGRPRSRPPCSCVGRHTRGLWLKICIVSQPSSSARSSARTRPPAVETWAPISICRRVRASVQVRAQPDRLPAHRRRADGTLQLAAGAQVARERARAAARGHRPRALHRRGDRPDPGRARAGSASTGTRARSARPSAPSATRSASSGCSSAGAAYWDTAGAEEVKQAKEARGGAGYRGTPVAGGHRGRRRAPARPRRGRDRRARRDPRRVALREPRCSTTS